MNHSRIKETLLDLVSEVFQSGNPKYEIKDLENIISLMYDIIIYQNNDKETEGLAHRLLEVSQSILIDEDITSNNLDLLSTKLEPFIKKVLTLIGKTCEGKNLCGLLKEAQINDELTLHNCDLNATYNINEKQYLYYIASAYQIRNETHNAKRHTVIQLSNLIKNVFVVYIYIVAKHQTALGKKVYELRQMVPINEQEGEWLYDYLSYGQSTASLKNGILNAYIISCLYEHEKLTVLELADKCQTFFNIGLNKKDLGRFIKTLGGSIVQTRDTLSLSEEERERVKKSKKEYLFNKEYFNSNYSSLLAKYKIDEKYRDELLKDVIEYFASQYDICDEIENIDNDKYAGEFQNKLRKFVNAKDAKNLVIDLLHMCSESDYIRNISACKVLSKMMDMDKYEQLVQQTRPIYVDTQFILYYLCLNHEKYPHFWNEDRYEITRDICQESKKHIHIEFCYSKHYLPEIVNQFKSALNLIPYERIFSVTSGLSNNVFYCYFCALKDNLILEEEDTFGDFMKNFYYLTEDDVYKPNFEDICIANLNDYFRTKGQVKITTHKTSLIEQAKRAFEDAIANNQELKNKNKSPYVLKNDAIMLSILANESNKVTPIFLTWDKSFSYASKEYLNSYARSSDSIWHIFTPTRYYNNLSLLKLNVDKLHTSESVMSILNSNISSATKTIYDCHNRLLDIRNIAKEQRHKYIQNIKDIFNDKEFDFGQPDARTHYEGILDMINNSFNENTYYKDCLLDDNYFVQVATVIKNSIKIKESITDTIQNIQNIINGYAAEIQQKDIL